MAIEVDLRNRPADEHGPVLLDALAEAATGDQLEIVADQDVDTALVRYQIEHGRALEWEYSHPDEEPRELRVIKGEPLPDGERGAIDVRDLKPQRRHEALLATFDELEPDEGFVLVNDHDPKPLYHELVSMHGDVVDWEYRSRGSDGWQVEITRTGASEVDDDDIVTRYDVRRIPKQERHPTIHHRYGMIPDGGTMELIAPHEPRPLHQEFRQRYGDSFTWKVVEQEPGQCRVQITKGGPGDAEADSTSSGQSNTTTDPAGEAIEVTEELDVRDLPPAQRHERIYDAYADLDDGEGFVLVNDHDPKPLYHQFEAEAGPEFRWEYRRKEPEQFEVLIGKSETVASTDGEPDAPF